MSSPAVETRSDADLITAVRGGDTAAFGLLFERHRDAAERLSRQLTQRGDADDLVSESFMKVLAQLQGGKGPDTAFRAYLLTSIRRLHIDRIRATKRVDVTDEPERLDRGEAFVDTAVAGFEQGAAARAFASLPERWQLALWHVDVEGQRPAEVAPLLGMSANSVSALLYRAREGLRQAFLQFHLTEATSTQCQWTTERLGSHVRDGLGTREATRVDGHLDECRRCMGVYLELREVASDLRGVLGPILLGGAFGAYSAATSAAHKGLFAAAWESTRSTAGQATSSGANVAASVAVAGVVVAAATVFTLHDGDPASEATAQEGEPNPDAPAESDSRTGSDGVAGSDGAVDASSETSGSDDGGSQSASPDAQRPPAVVPPAGPDASTEPPSERPAAPGPGSSPSGPTPPPDSGPSPTPPPTDSGPSPTPPPTEPPPDEDDEDDVDPPVVHTDFEITDISTRPSEETLGGTIITAVFGAASEGSPGRIYDIVATFIFDEAVYIPESSTGDWACSFSVLDFRTLTCATSTEGAPGPLEIRAIPLLGDVSGNLSITSSPHDDPESATHTRAFSSSDESEDTSPVDPDGPIESVPEPPENSIDPPPGTGPVPMGQPVDETVADEPPADPDEPAPVEDAELIEDELSTDEPLEDESATEVPLEDEPVDATPDDSPVDSDEVAE